MNWPAVIALVMNGGLLLVLVLPGLVVLVVKLRAKLRGRPGLRPGRAGERAAEIEDVFHPAQRHQLEQMEISDSLRVDAETGDDDPLDDLPAHAEVRARLDPDRVDQRHRPQPPGAAAGNDPGHRSSPDSR